MKIYISILTIFVSLHISAQEFLIENFVECYYSKKVNEPILIYDNPNGKKVGKLAQRTEEMCWYKFAISESQNGWLKIKKMIALPGCGDDEFIDDFDEYKGKWVLAKNMVISIDCCGKIRVSCLEDKSNKGFVENGYTFYKNPNLESEIAFCIKGFTESELMEINGTWAKLKIEHNGKVYIGWLPKKYHCTSPWTTCPVYD